MKKSTPDKAPPMFRAAANSEIGPIAPESAKGPAETIPIEPGDLAALVLAHKRIESNGVQLPAALLPGFDRPLVSWVLDDLWDRGIRHLVVTVDERLPLVERWFDLDQRFEFAVTILPVSWQESPAEILVRLPVLKLAAIVDSAALRASAESPVVAGPLPSVSSLEDYRRQLLGLVSRRQWNAGLPGILVNQASIVESAGDRAVGESNPRCFIGRGTVVSPRSNAHRCVLLKGAALLGDCDLDGCVVMPGTIVRDLFARDAVIGFDCWAKRLLRSARRAAGKSGQPIAPRSGLRAALRFRLASSKRRLRWAEELLEQTSASGVECDLRQSVIDWLLAHPQEALSHDLILR